ncbi:MAG: signal peptidase [Candidatus Saccharibacteria bacterium]|nr:signal peptidase [Candidatus Saccharibacteria bacterium]
MNPEHPNHHQHPDPQTPRSRKNGLYAALSSFFVFLVVPLLIAFILTAFVIQSYQVDGQSMETTLQNHDRLLVDKVPRTWARLTSHQYVPSRGDIIIFNQTGLPDSFFEKQLIKRVIGLPGERVVIKDGHITVYNKANTGGFNPDTTGKYRIAATITSGDIDVRLGANEIFVCGDNRSNSEDSRYFGPVGLNNVVGKLVLRIMPLGNTRSF